MSSYNLEEKRRNEFENNLFIFQAYILSEDKKMPEKVLVAFNEMQKFLNNPWGNKRFIYKNISDIYIDLYSSPLNEMQKSKMKDFFQIRNFKEFFNNSSEIGILLNQVLTHNEDHFELVFDFFKDNLTVENFKYMSLPQLINKHPDKIKMFFKPDYDFEEDSTSWNYKIMFETLNNAPEQLKTLVDSGLTVRSRRGILNKTLLHYLAVKNDIKNIDLLLELGADINAEDKNGNTPLYDSYILNKDTVFPHLLNNNAVISKTMMLSLIEEQDNIVYKILDNYSFDKNTSIEISAAIEFWPEIMPLLLTYKDININSACNIKNSFNNIYYTPIGRILERYKDDKVQQEKWIRILIEKGADINKISFKGSLGITNLQLAKYADENLFMEIFKATDEEYFKNRPERQNQLIISFFDYPSKLKSLIKNGYNIDCVSGNDIDRQTPLFKAVQENKKEAVKILLENGANVLSRDKDRQTPLFIAKDPEIIFMLLEYGSNPNIKNKNSIKLLDAASEDKRDIIESYLDNKKLKKDFNKNFKNMKKKSIL